MANFRKRRDIAEEERGLIGIGALIVFIAIVIVSAVATGIIIKTSLSLQQQARATTKETIREISSGLRVLDAKGKTSMEERLENITLVCRPYPGTRSINLENTVIQYKSDYEVKYLQYDGDNNVIVENSESEFEVEKVQDRSGSCKTQLSVLGDVSLIKIRLGSGKMLGANERASITIIPNTGFKTYYEVFMPGMTSENEWYLL